MKNNYTMLTNAPFCNSNPSINTVFKVFMLTLIPHIGMLFITKSYPSLILLGITIVAAFFADILFALIKKSKEYITIPTFAQGVFIGFFLPSSYPPITAFLTVFVVLLCQKYVFRSIGQSWANAPIVISIILYFISPHVYPDFLISPTAFKFPNMGVEIFSKGFLSPSLFDTTFTSFLNSVFHKYSISIPTGYITLLWDTQSIIPAFRFNLFTLIASLILVSYKTVDFLIPSVFIGTYILLVRFFSLYPYGNIVGQGDILLALFTGGTLFVGFFILPWFGTYPYTNIGKICYALIVAVIFFLIGGGGTSSTAIFFSILLANIISPLLQYIEDYFYTLVLQKKFATITLQSEQ